MTDENSIKPLLQVLIAEDDVDDFYLVKEMLGRDQQFSYRLHHATCLCKTIEILHAVHIDVVLLDLNLEDSRGIETVEKVVSVETEKPIVVLTGLNEDHVGRAAIKAGAEDYIPKTHANTHSVTRAIAYAIERHRLMLELRRRADEDPLTKIPNRGAFFRKLDTLVEQAKRSTLNIAFVMIDLDDFKLINDRYGHRAGDAVLVEVSQRLLQNLRRSDSLARFGGDEFVMLMTNYQDRAQLATVLEKKRQQLSEPFSLAIDNKHLSLRVSASIGAVEWCGEATAEALVAKADAKMYESKEQGKGRVSFW